MPRLLMGVLIGHNHAKVEDGDGDRQRRQTQPGINTAVQSESTSEEGSLFLMISAIMTM